MSAKAGFCSLRILEFHNTNPLDRLFADTEESCGNLGNDVVVVRYQLFRIATLTGAAKGAERRCRPHA